jgi:hypothetical protein
MGTLIRRPLRKSITRGIARLRSEGQRHLGTARERKPRPLPSLRGDDLAREHLEGALDALREPGTSKPEAFRKLRLLVNQLEQSGGRKKASFSPVPLPEPAGLAEIASLADHSRSLVYRAMETAQQHLRSYRAAS